jgi:hypothetical protein
MKGRIHSTLTIGRRARVALALAGVATAIVSACCVAQADAYVLWTNCHSCHTAAIGIANENGTEVNEHVINSAYTTAPEGLAIADEHLYWAWKSLNYSEAFSPWVQDGVAQTTLIGFPSHTEQADFIGDATPSYFPSGIAIAGKYVYVAFGNPGPLWATKLSGPGPWINTFSSADASGVAAGGGYLYWADDATNKIARGKLNGSGGVKGVDESFISGAKDPCGLAVRGNYIYWADRGNNSIGRADVKGSHATHVDQKFITGAHDPHGVAVDSEYIYWANTSKGTIGRAKLDGKEVKEKFITGAKHPEWVAAGGEPANVSPPKISGTAKQGDKLTELHGVWVNGTKSFSYQWQRCNRSGGDCNPISGAINRSYTLTAADVGDTIRVGEYAWNLYGGSPWATSAATSVVTPPAPANTTLPSISGTTVQGQTLALTRGAWSNSPTGFIYQWEDCNSAGGACAPSATSDPYAETYLLTLADAGHTMRVRVWASNAGGTSAPALSPATKVVLPLPPVSSSAPSIAGDLTQGQTLTEVPAAWSNDPTSFSYRWKSCDPVTKECTVVGTEKSYKLTAADVGNTITVLESASNAGGTGGPVSSPTTAAVLAPPHGHPSAPVISLPPVITGQVAVGQTLSASSGAWLGAPPLTYSYQWQLCKFFSCSNIASATTSSYTVGELPPGDAGAMLRVVVTASNEVGEAAAESAEVGPLPALSPPVPPPPFEGGHPM